MHRSTLPKEFGRTAGFALSVAFALAPLTLCTTRAKAATSTFVTAPQWTAQVVMPVDDMRQAPAANAHAIAVVTSDGLAALDAATGKRIWNVPSAMDAVVADGGIVYANRSSAEGGVRALTLVALDARDGHQLWSRPEGGGILGIDESGVVVGNQSGISRYARDGALRWHLATIGGYDRVLVNNDRVVALSEREGAILHGEVESIDRRTGRLIGSQVWWGRLLAIQPHRAQAESDYPGDFDTWCGDAELLDASLDVTAGDHILAEQRADYILEDMSLGTPPPPAISYQSTTPCTGARSGHPAIILDGAHVVLASGAVLGIFDRSKPGAPFALYRDATFVGGPFAGRLYVQRPHGLDALTIGSARAPRFFPLVSHAAAIFTVAGIGDRLYVSDGATTIAFGARIFDRRAEYRIGCTHLVAVTRTQADDILQCEHGPSAAEIVALRR